MKHKHSKPLPLGPAVALGFTAVVILGTLGLSDSKSLDEAMTKSVTEPVSSINQAQSNRALSDSTLAQGAPIEVMRCLDGSGASFQMQRMGSQFVLSGLLFDPSFPKGGQAHTSLVFGQTQSLDESRLSFNVEGDGEIHFADSSVLKLTSIEIDRLQDRYGAVVVLDAKNLRMELSGCQVNTQALLQTQDRPKEVARK
jgi:hypothetical protein